MKQESENKTRTLLMFEDGAVDYDDVSAIRFYSKNCHIFFKDGRNLVYKLFPKEPEDWAFCLFPITRFTEQFVFIADKTGIPFVKRV